MKTKILFFLLLIGAISTSCTKEQQPIVLVGEWDLDANYVYSVIRYDPAIGTANPTAVQFLIDKEDELTEPLKYMEKITFSDNGSVTFTYEDSSIETGTYVLDGTYITIECDIYPDGLAAATDGETLELYYPKNYMDEILYNLLSSSTPSQELFATLIQTFLGVATYRSSAY